MMKFRHVLLGAGLVMGASLPASAHDFWLSPAKYQSSPTATVAVQFKVGHNDSAEDWNLRWDKVVALRNYTPDGVADLSASIIQKSDLLPGAAKTQSLEAGTYVIGLESYHSVSELSAEPFNNYVEEEGLTAIHDYRQQKGLTGTAGTELYSRKAKTIIQVGDKLTQNAVHPVGHTLEIIPESHPYDLGEKAALPVKVLFRGHPLEGALIKSSALKGANHKAQSVKTDSDGKAMVSFDEKGPVKLTVVWGEPLSGNPRADFETYFSSLTFSVNPGKN